MADSNREKDKVNDLVELYGEDWDADRENRDKALSDIAFSSGKQWDEDDREARGTRPTLTLNHAPKFIRQIVGDLRNVRPSIRVTAVGNGSDKDMAEVYNGLIRNIEARSKASQPYTRAVDSAVRAGIGHFRILTEKLPSNPFSQDISIKPIYGPAAVVWDHQARDIVRAEAMHCFVRESMSLRAFKKANKGARPLDFGDRQIDPPELSYWGDSKNVMVAEMFERVETKAPFALLEDQRVLRLDRLPASAIFDPLNKAILFANGERVLIDEIEEAKVFKVVWRKMTGVEILETGEWPTSDIPIIPVIGEEIHFEDHMERAGIVRHMRDAQKSYNFWRSTQTEVIGAMPKLPYLIGKSQIEGYEEAWLAANIGTKPFLPYDDSKNQSRPTREIPPQISSGMQNEIALAVEDMKATTGIYDAALGNRSNETSGVGIRQRQQESDVATNFFGDNLQASMTRAGRIMVDLIRVVYDHRRVARILNEDDSDEMVTLNDQVIENGISRIVNDVTVGDYDVVVDIGPAYATRRQEALEGMAEILRGNPNATMFLDIIAKNSDWPGADQFAKRAHKLLPPQAQDEDEEELTPEQQRQKADEAGAAQMQQAAQLAQFKADLDEKNAKTAKTMQDAEGVELDNVMKKLDISALTGAVQQAVMLAVVQALAPPGPAPQQVQPGPTPLNGGVF